MKTTIVSLCVVICLVFAGTAAATTVEKLGTYETLWIVQSDPIVAQYNNIIWKPPVKGDKRDYEESDLGPGLNCVYSCVERAVCWRLDAGVAGDIDWASVRSALNTTYGVSIGQPMSCFITGEVTAPRCYCACADLYAVYARDQYRVTQNGKKATVSVLVPTSGMGVVYHHMTRLSYPCCAGAAPPETISATCASMGTTPLVGNPCIPGSGKGDGDRDFEDAPSLKHDPEEAATWGKIKALYVK